MHHITTISIHFQYTGIYKKKCVHSIWDGDGISNISNRLRTQTHRRVVEVSRTNQAQQHLTSRLSMRLLSSVASWFGINGPQRATTRLGFLVLAFVWDQFITTHLFLGLDSYFIDVDICFEDRELGDAVPGLCSGCK